MKRYFRRLIYSLFFLLGVRANAADDLIKYIDLCSTSTGAFYQYRTLSSVPPVIGGELAKTTFADLCDLLVKVYNLNNHIQNLAAKGALNGITQTNWQTDLLLTTTISNVVASKYYGEAEPTQPADIENAREDEAMKNFYASIGNDDRISASAFRSDREAAQSMDSFERAARQQAMLKEALICPDNSNNQNYQKIYTQQILPLTTERERFKLKRDHYLRRLREIGPTFLGRDDAEMKYSAALDQLRQTAIVIRAVDDSKGAKYYEKYAPAKFGDEARVVPTSRAKVNTQSFYSDQNSSIFAKFRADWAPRWKDYVDHTYDKIDVNLTVADNCLPTPASPARTDLLNPLQVTSLAQWQRQCRDANKNKAVTPPAFLFEEALTRYQQNSEQFAALQAQIWTKESQALGKPLMKVSETKGAVDLDNTPNCNAEPMSESKLLETRTKLLETENEFKEIVAKEKIKDGMLRDEEMKRQREGADKERITSSVLSRQKATEKGAVQSNIHSPTLDGSF